MIVRSTWCLVIMWMIFSACADEPTAPRANSRPETHIAVDTVATEQSSRLLLHWYADDADGIVNGYLVSMDRKTWFFTRKNDSLFSLRIENNDTSYLFSVSSVDNSLKNYPIEGAIVQFADANSNGLYDNGEEFLSLEGACDLTPATTRFPIRNTQPVVFFGSDSTSIAAKQVQLPDSTFTVATFQFGAYDLDGAETIAYFEYALNDTASTNWRRISTSQTFITLTSDSGLVSNSDNAFYLRAVDIGALKSKVLRYPQPGKTWYVRKPKGNILIIKDHDLPAADNFYQNSVQTIASGKFAGKVDVLDLRTGGKTRNIPPFINPMFIETLKLFKAVIWYSDAGANYRLAQESLPEYIRSGGHALYAADLPNPISSEAQTALIDFAPVDSVSAFEITSNPLDIKNNSEIVADTSGGTIYSNFIKETGTVNPHALYPKITAKSLYRLPASTKWTGNPVVAVRSEDRRMIFVGLPLYLLNKSQTAELFLQTVLTGEFGL
ncbi:MAG: hypothetical protein U0264_02365 [Candidatus Kapaibacterium sp.]